MLSVIESLFNSLGVNPTLGVALLIALLVFGVWFAWLSYETWLHESVNRNYYDEIGADSKNLAKHRRELIDELRIIIVEHQAERHAERESHGDVSK